MMVDILGPGAALLDVDGTLIDSNGAHASAWSDALGEFGHAVPAARIRPLIGMGGDKLLPRVTGISAESPAGIGISERRTEIFRRNYLPAIKPFPGVRSLLERMRGEGLKLVVATSATGDELGGLLDVAGIEDLLDGATSSSDAEESKPDPDIVEAAMARTGCESSRIVMLGDTPYDVEAARRAGIRIVAVRCGGWGDADLKGAAAVYDDPADLLARFNESPFARQ